LKKYDLIRTIIKVGIVENYPVVTGELLEQFKLTDDVILTVDLKPYGRTGRLFCTAGKRSS